MRSAVEWTHGLIWAKKTNFGVVFHVFQDGELIDLSVKAFRDDTMATATFAQATQLKSEQNPWDPSLQTSNFFI